MAFKLLKTAEERWRRFNGHELVADVLAGKTFEDGIRVPDEHPTQDEKAAAGPSSRPPHPQPLTVAPAPAVPRRRPVLSVRAGGQLQERPETPWGRLGWWRGVEVVR